jgi:hypothetical protein
MAANIQQSVTQQQPQDEWVFLSGRPPMGEYLGFVQGNAADEASVNLQTLSNEWRAANTRIVELELTEAGIANNPGIQPIPDSLKEAVEQVQNAVPFKKSFQVVPVTIGLIDLDQLVVFQKYINTTYAAELKARLGATPSEQDIFELCLPLNDHQPPLRRMRVGPNSFVFVSPSQDLRFIESTDFDASRIVGYDSLGSATGVIGIVIGFGSNYLNAVHANNRLVLNNGSHRAYALRDMGVKQVPCIVQHVNHPEGLAVVSQPIAANPAAYLGHARPSMLKDYFDPQLRKLVPVWRKSRQVKVEFGVDMMDVPGV